MISTDSPADRYTTRFAIAALNGLTERKVTMAEENASAQNSEEDLASRFPTAYTILLLLIVLVAALTWVIPAG